jgi:hypothetical protein
MIPRTLAEVADLTARGASFDLCLRDFLDGFLAAPRVTALEAEPMVLANKVAQVGNIEDAYLAPTAEWLAARFNLQPPRWAFQESRFLRRPWFASQLSSLRALLLLESPAPFRSRNLFVSENALNRV